MVTLTTSGATLIKAGRDSSISGGNLFLLGDSTKNYAINDWIDEAEAFLGAATTFDWVAAYNDINSDKRKILDDVVSDLAAIKVINYDFANYPSRVIAEDMINVLRDSALFKISVLRDKAVQDYINGV